MALYCLLVQRNERANLKAICLKTNSMRIGYRVHVMIEEDSIINFPLYMVCIVYKGGLFEHRVKVRDIKDSLCLYFLL